MTDLLINRQPVRADFIGGEIVSTGISFDDYSRMTTQLHRLNSGRQLAAPAWVYNDDQLCAVITRCMERRAGMRKMLAGTNSERMATAQQELEKIRPELVARIDRMCNRFVAAKREGADHETVRLYGQKVEELDTQIRILSIVPKLLAGAAYYYWRCGFDSVAASQQLGIRPPHVRQLLQRLLASAEELRYAPQEAIAAQPSKRKNRKRQTVYSTEGSAVVKGIAAGPIAEIIRLHKEGRFTADIARELKLGANGSEVVNLILIQAGLR